MSSNQFNYQWIRSRQYKTQNYEMEQNAPQVSFFDKILCQPKQNALQPRLMKQKAPQEAKSWVSYGAKS